MVYEVSIFVLIGSFSSLLFCYQLVGIENESIDTTMGLENEFHNVKISQISKD